MGTNFCCIQLILLSMRHVFFYIFYYISPQIRSFHCATSSYQFMLSDRTTEASSNLLLFSSFFIYTQWLFRFLDVPPPMHPPVHLPAQIVTKHKVYSTPNFTSQRSLFCSTAKYTIYGDSLETTFFSCFVARLLSVSN